MNSLKNRRINVVLFDYGGVLAEEGFRDGLKAIAARQGLNPEEMHRAAMDAVYDSGYVLGRGSEADFWALLRKRTGLAGQDDALTAEILSRFVLRPRLLDLVRVLRRRGVCTAILSDQTDWLDRLDGRDGFFHAFDVVFNSYRLGKGKRDATLFDDVLRRLSVRPEEALFIDDARGNVERARSRGLQALLYRNAESLEDELEAIIGGS